MPMQSTKPSTKKQLDCLSPRQTQTNGTEQCEEKFCLSGEDFHQIKLPPLIMAHNQSSEPTSTIVNFLKTNEANVLQ